MALSSKVIKTGANLYYDPSFTGTLIADSVTDVASAEDAVTALEALTWSDVGMLSNLTVGMGLENTQEVNALNCGVGTIADLADLFARITPTLLEAKNFNLWKEILGGTSIVDGVSFSEYYHNTISQIEVPQGRFRIVSCPYQTGLTTAGKEWARDYYYLEKASLDGELVLTFLNKGEVPTGSQFILNGKTGGKFFVHTDYGATEAAVS